MYLNLPPLLLTAIILFSIALVLYTTSVWSEHIQRQLRTWHLFVFGLGVFTDAVATWLTIEFVGAIVFTPHALLGFASLILMALHFCWALIVFISAHQFGTVRFHQFSLLVWSVWMVSYITGYLTGMQKFI